MDAQAIIARLAHDALTDQRVFPTSVDNALRVRRAAENPDCDLNRLAQQVKSEPLLAARLISLANSVAYNPGGRLVADVRSALLRLGMATVRDVAVAQIIHQMDALPPTPADRKLAHQLWLHTTHVAALAHVLTRHLTRADPEVAFFAGLIHEVGGFYLLARVAELGGLRPDLLEHWHQGQGAVAVGRALLQRLEVPAQVCSAVETLWDGFFCLPPHALGDILLLANALSPVPSPLEVSTADAVPELGEIEASLGDTRLQAILGEAADEIRELQGLIDKS